MINPTRNVSSKPESLDRDLNTKSAASNALDIIKKIYDEEHGKWSLPQDLKEISNTSHAEMKKIPSISLGSINKGNSQ